MSQKQKRGTQVSNKFFLKDNYRDETYYEKAVQKEVQRLQEFYWLYEGRKVGIVTVHRNKHGARVIAYNKKVS
ncbi:MAG: hypothetical protein J6C46_00090 [Clostridia bacterium]|nr:hypothetical protein [Clostridia bacterium]